MSAAGRCDPGVEPSDRKDRGEEHDDQPTACAIVQARHGEDKQGAGASGHQGPAEKQSACERAGPAEAGARSKRRPGVWRGSPDQDRARFPPAGRRLSGVPEGQGFEQKEPALRIRVVGQAPIAATVYELERLRCNLCGEIFEAEAPASVGERSTTRRRLR